MSEREQTIARAVLKEIRARLGFLVDVGLDYLTIDRTSSTLSGGEAQRIRLATQIGSSLVGVLYILDEPTIGLHQKDNAKLIATLIRLRDLGNTLIVVEHDEETIRTADWVIDIGPAAGEHGGEVIASGTLEHLLATPDSVTGAFLRGERAVPIPKKRRSGTGKSLRLKGVRAHNLKDVDVRFPLGTFTAVTGVSGSGKSTLVTDVLYRALAQSVNGARDEPGEHDSLEGTDAIDKIIEIDQSPIGRTPRSNPATYTGLFGPIRELFAGVPESRVRGYGPGRFSFNVKGGRCENCKGDGILKIEMQFLPDVYVPCEVCAGRRYDREALEIHYRGHSIADILEMTVEEALAVFQPVPTVRNKLQTLVDVGLGYVRLGQPATTLSGGEAQRVKLATELSRRATGRTVYLLDEPTTGLHFADVEKLLEVLHRLVDTGNTIIVIEHNLDVIKTADHIIDMGPEGGARGGRVIAKGTPEEVAATAGSATGEYLARVLRGEPIVPMSDVTFAQAAGAASDATLAKPDVRVRGRHAVGGEHAQARHRGRVDGAPRTPEAVPPDARREPARIDFARAGIHRQDRHPVPQLALRSGRLPRRDGRDGHRIGHDPAAQRADPALRRVPGLGPQPARAHHGQALGLLDRGRRGDHRQHHRLARRVRHRRLGRAAVPGAMGQVHPHPAARDRGRGPLLREVGQADGVHRTAAARRAHVHQLPGWRHPDAHRLVHRLFHRRRVPVEHRPGLGRRAAGRQLGGHPPPAPAVRHPDAGAGRRAVVRVHLVATGHARPAPTGGTAWQRRRAARDWSGGRGRAAQRMRPSAGSTAPGATTRMTTPETVLRWTRALLGARDAGASMRRRGVSIAPGAIPRSWPPGSRARSRGR